QSRAWAGRGDRIQRPTRHASCRSVALERRALQRQITGVRLPDGDPADFRDRDAAIFELNPLRDAERLRRAVLLLVLREARSLLKEVVKRSLAVSKSLLQQLRIDLFPPLEAGLVFQFGQFSRRLRPGDGLAGLLRGLFSTLKRPVENKPARARITRE